jgi:hypothetical protein
MTEIKKPPRLKSRAAILCTSKCLYPTFYRTLLTNNRKHEGYKICGEDMPVPMKSQGLLIFIFCLGFEQAGFPRTETDGVRHFMSGSDDLPHGLLNVKKNLPGSKCPEINGINA